MQQSNRQKALYGVVFIILIGFLVFAIVSSRHSKVTPPTGVSKLNQSSDDQANNSPSASNTPDQPAAPTPSPSTSTSGTSGAASKSTDQLATTGPKETVTLFVAAVATGTAVAHLRQRRAMLK